jgi:acyl carrier protein
MSNDLIQTNTAKLTAAFASALVVAETQIHDDLAYNSIKEWDSTAHMLLIAELENAFDVMLDTDDIIDMSSVGKAKTILAKYGVAF